MEPRQVGPYRLARKLGAGGMGVVYARSGRAMVLGFGLAKLSASG